MILFAFDRDLTVSSSPDPGPVPVDLVRALVAGNEVWAIGNQALVAEAGICGLDELWRRLGGKIPKIGEPTGWTAKEISADEAKRNHNIASKRARLEGLARLFPNAAMKIAVDDLDISYRGWIYLTPQNFVDLAEACWRAKP